MTQVPSDHASSSSPFPLDQMIIAPLAGQVIGLNDSAFVMAEWADPGAPAGPPRLIAPFHVHYTDDEAWYVLEGTLAFQLGEQHVQASAGTAVFAPRGVPHTYWNPSPTPARYLLIMTPMIRQLINELHRSTERDPVALQALYQRYNSDLVSSPFMHINY
jgi:mannose-6-phosphate isomerase-like protein (cupin superfamily)